MCSARWPGGNCGRVLDGADPEVDRPAVGGADREALDVAQARRASTATTMPVSTWRPGPPSSSVARATSGRRARRRRAGRARRDPPGSAHGSRAGATALRRRCGLLVKRRSRCSRACGAACRRRRAGRSRRPARTSAGRAARATAAGRPGRSPATSACSCPPAPVDEHRALDDLAAHRLDRGEHREQRAAGREDVVDEEDALAGSIRKPRRNSRRVAPSASLTSSAKIARDAELAAGLEREDHAAGGRAGDEVDARRVVRCRGARRPEAAQLARRGRVREDRELLEVGVASGGRS